LRLQRADILANKTINGEATQLLTGDVVFTKESMTMSSDRARWKDKIKQGTLSGNVVIVKEGRTLTCDSLYYNSNIDLMKTFGRTHIWDDDYDLEADSLIFYSEKDSGDALGNVQLLQKSQDIHSDQMTYVKKLNNDAVSYTANGNVTIIEINEDRRASCGKAIYNRDEENTILLENPKLYDGKRELTGKSINLYYSEEVLNYMFIPSQSHAISSVDGWREITKNDTLIKKDTLSFMDDMSGNAMHGYFVDGELDSLRLEGMATTLYHILEDSVYQGKNKASGDTIIMRFGEQELNDIQIYGGARGTYTPDSTNSELESNIIYKAENIVYGIKDEITVLDGQANLHHATTDMDAGYITVDMKTSMLYAIPVALGDTITPPIVPTIVEKGDEPMTGEAMAYNLKTKKGRISKGRTKSGDSYYAGTTIRNEGKKEFYIKNSLYTSCDLEDPHFHFAGERMKMIQKEKIISKPMIFQISHIPLIGLPFIILPNQGGRRHSGWIMPTYGDSKNRGQYMDGGGYFFSPSDYWDYKTLVGFSDKQGFRMRNYIRYKKRYWYSGNLLLEGKWRLSQGNNIATLKDNYKQDIVAKWNHKHTLRHNQSFSASVQYYSNGEYNYKTGTDINDRLKQTAKSNVTYSKRWKSGNSLSLNASANQDLMVDRKIDATSDFYEKPTSSGKELTIVSANLPNASFRLGNKNPFKSKDGNPHWYNNLSTNYSTSLNRKLRTFYKSEEYDDTDSTVAYRWNLDSDGKGKVYSEEQQNINHSYGLSSPFKIFRYISVNPNLSMKTNWFDRYYETIGLDSVANKPIREETMGFASRTTGSMSMKFNTNVYGLFPVSVGSLGAVRHTMTPSIGYSYTPDFSKPVFGRDLGYFETIADTSGEILLSDRFQGTSQQEQKSMSMSLRNIVEAKWGKAENEKIIKLINWNMNTSYNFAKEEFQLNNLSSRITTQLGKIMNLQINMTHDFYEYDNEEKKRISTLRTSELSMPFSDNGKLNIPNPRLYQASFNTSFKFSGKRWTQTFEEELDTTKADTTVLDDEELFGDDFLPQRSQNQYSGGQGQLWTASFAINYSLNKSNPDDIKKTFWVSANSNINVTKSWKVGYSARFNMLETQLVSHSFSINKDLHCWELSLKWTPTGPGAGYFLKINVKSPNLRDIKFEEKGGIHSFRSGF